MNAINKTMLRKQCLSDAECFYKTLTNPNIEHFTILPQSIEAEKEWIQSNEEREKQSLEFHFTILYNDEIAGSIGVKRQTENQEIGIVGYFIDPNFWSMGIATEALGAMEMICKTGLNFKILRLEMMIENKASERVAIKRCFSKVATLKNYLKDKYGKERDCYIYEKVLGNDKNKNQMNYQIVSYSPVNKHEVLGIFKSNCPKYFSMDEYSEFEQYLDHYTDENFLLIKNNNTILGCGGYYVNYDKKCFGIAWVMFKRYELGLTNFIRLSQLFFDTIIEKIKSHQLDYDVVVNTSQLLEKTLNKFGFETSEVIKNGFGEGLDHYVMRKRIN